MPMSFGGHVASSSACATRPKEQEIGSADYAVPTQHSSPIGHSVMAMAEHREPCDSRGSCTVLGAPGGETPPGDSSSRLIPRCPRYVLWQETAALRNFYPAYDHCGSMLLKKSPQRDCGIKI